MCAEPSLANSSCLNKHLVRDLIELGIWGIEMKDEILRHKGSVQNIAGIPDNVKELYKTTWEIKQRHVLDMSADRGAYVDQSQSLNIHMVDANPAKGYFNALLRMEAGTQNRNVLSSNQGCSRCNSIHC